MANSLQSYLPGISVVNKHCSGNDGDGHKWVSTRKVEIITEELCGKKFSKSTVSALCKKLDPIIEAFRTRPLKYHYPFLVVDAIYVKVRENGRVRSRGLLIAIGINEEGYREVIGFQLANSESESCWGEFFSSLKERGLKNVDLVTSDEHKGLVNAVKRHFQGAGWQRCQPIFRRTFWIIHRKHYSLNLKKSFASFMKPLILKVPAASKTVLSKPMKQRHRKLQLYWDEAFDDITAVLALL